MTVLKTQTVINLVVVNGRHQDNINTKKKLPILLYAHQPQNELKNQDRVAHPTF